MNLEFTPIILIIIGLVLSLCGYKIKKILITFAWFLIGFNLSSLLMPHFITNETTLLITSIIIGIFLAMIGHKIEKLAVYIAVAYLTYKALNIYLIFDNPNTTLLINGFLSLLVGAFSVKLIRPIIIIVSSIYGASLIAINLPIIFNIPNIAINIISIILIIISIIYQLRTTKDWWGILCLFLICDKIILQ